jgi:hypothetical protein
MVTYWAELNDQNIVQQVITGVDDATINGVPASDWYSTYVGAPCVQTYYDTPGVVAAGIGYTYDPIKNIFISPYPDEE